MMNIDMESVRFCFGVQIRSKVQQCYSLYHWVTNARGLSIVLCRRLPSHGATEG